MTIGDIWTTGPVRYLVALQRTFSIRILCTIGGLDQVGIL